MDSYPFIAGGLGKAAGVTLRQIHVRPVRSAEGQRAHGVALRLRGAGKRRRDDLLRTNIRCAIITVIAHLFIVAIHPSHRHWFRSVRWKLSPT